MGSDGDQHSRQRDVADEQRRAELIAGYKASGLTQREFARREGIDYNTLGAWLWQQQHRAISPPSKPPQLVGPATGPLEVTLPGKIVVRGNDPSAVATLVQALRNAGVADGSAEI